MQKGERGYYVVSNSVDSSISTPATCYDYSRRWRKWGDGAQAINTRREHKCPEMEVSSRINSATRRFGVSIWLSPFIRSALTRSFHTVPLWLTVSPISTKSEWMTKRTRPIQSKFPGQNLPDINSDNSSAQGLIRCSWGRRSRNTLSCEKKRSWYRVS